MKRNFFLLFALLFFSFSVLPGYGQQVARFEWLNLFQGRAAKSDGYPDLPLLDNSGNTYTLIKYRGNVTFSTMSAFNSDTLYQCSLTKLNPQGDIIWQLPITWPAPGGGGSGPGIDTHFLIGGYELGPRNSVYLLAHYQAGIQIGTFPSPTTQARSVLAKVDSTGQVVWQSTDMPYGAASTLTVDAAGNAYVGGGFQRSLTLNSGQTVLTQSFPPRVFIGQSFGAWCASYAAVDGHFRWARQSYEDDSLSHHYIQALRTDANGHLYTRGYVRGTVHWGAPGGMTTQSAHPDSINISVMKIDAATGTGLRQFTLNARPDNYPPSFAVDAAGNSYLACSFRGQVDLNGRVLRSAANSPNWQVDSWTARYDPNGVLQWAAYLHGDSSRLENTGLAIDPLGHVYLTGSVHGAGSGPRTFYFGNQPAPTIHASSRASLYVSALDQATGQTQSVRLVTASRATVIGYELNANTRGDIALLGYFYGTDTATVRVDGLTARHNRFSPYTGDQFIAKLTQQYNTVTGEVFVDANANDQHDPTESPYPYGAVVETLPDHRHFTSDAAGLYDAFVQLSTHTIAMPYPPPYYVAVPVNAVPIVSFSSYGNLSPNHDFALRPIPNQQDVRVNLIPVNRARPGFPVKYRLTYRNVGTVVLPSGNVTLTLDPLLAYLSNTGGGTRTGSTLTVPYAGLLPGQTRNFDVLCQLPTTAPLGNTLVSTAAITPLTGDLTPGDNTETSRLRVTGSFDPNNIEVNFPTLTPQQVAAGEWLEYTIRFQNMGTDTAFSILLRDSLPLSQLNLGTLQLIASSHSCTWSLAPGGVLNVSFTSIRLPHRAVNTIGSMGFVRFRVRPRGTLASGDLIPNRAEIHFDFNAPIVTNTALTEIDRPTGLSSTAAASLPGVVWPNPVSGLLNVEASLPASATLHLTLLDAVGRPVRVQTAQAATGLVRQNLDVSGLAAGLYLLRAQAGAASFTRRVVVK